MRIVQALILLVMIACSTSAQGRYFYAKEPLPVPSEDQIRSFVPMMDPFHPDSEFRCWIKAKGLLKCVNDQDDWVNGSWRVQGAEVHIKVGDKYDGKWKVLAGSDNVLVYLEGAKHIWMFCRGPEDCILDGWPLQVVPGSSDRKLYDQVIKKAFPLPVYTGPQKEGEQRFSELWYLEDETLLDDNGKTAQKIANKLSDIIGTVVPKRLKTSDGPYGMILVVGKVAAIVPPGGFQKVKVMFSNKESPLSKKVGAKIAEMGHSVLGVSKAKTPRTNLEVWYQKGKLEAANTLAKEIKALHPAPATVKEWTWGGKFDLLVITPAE